MQRLGWLLPISALTGCSTVSADLQQPPGVPVAAFNGCLQANGFFPSDKPSPAETGKTRGDLKRTFNVVAQILDSDLLADLDEPGNGAAAFTSTYGAVDRPYIRTKHWALNRFLDCYIGPIGPTANADKAAPLSEDDFLKQDADVEGRLLRGHILLAILARYGTELVVSRPGAQQVQQAELLLGHITDAEASLRDDSQVVTPDMRAAKLGVIFSDGIATTTDASKVAEVTYPPLGGSPPTQPALQWYRTVTRSLRVLQVGADIERIDLQNSIGRVTNIIAAFTGHSIDFTNILRDALRGLAAVETTHIYGDAFLRDARETLAVHRAGTSVVPGTGGGWAMHYTVAATAPGWQHWDDQLKEACTVLATVAKKDVTAAACGIPAPLPSS